MSPHEAVAPARKVASPSSLFTARRANRALVLVRKITADIVARYLQLIDLRAQAREAADDADSDAPPTRNDAEPALQAQIDRSLHLLGRLNRELVDIGCILRDWRTGLVDFPAVYQGRRVWLCWRLGEPAIEHWHTVDAGIQGRQPVDERFRRRSSNRPN